MHACMYRYRQVLHLRGLSRNFCDPPPKNWPQAAPSLASKRHREKS